MISPNQIKGKAARRYADYLRGLIQGETIFPLDLAFAKSKPGEAARRWSELGAELDELRRNSTEAKPGKSYSLEWEARRDRLTGAQNLPSRIYFQDEDSYLSFLGKTSEAERFKLDAAAIQNAFPDLKSWLASRPQRVIEHTGSWQPILAALRWLSDNPASGLYLREVPAVEDTKFIERHKTILRELLDQLSPAPDTAMDQSTPVTTSRRLSFEERCGLKTPAPLVRLRILDLSIARQRFSGLVDLALPADSLPALAFPEIRTILVIENKASFSNVEVFLTIPAMEASLAIFGSGYAVAALGCAPWLATRRIFYWGDIDSHGLRILAGFRLNFPGTVSVMMDRETFVQYRAYHSDAPEDTTAEPQGLTSEELALFRELVSSSKGNRLEQERIPLNYVQEQLNKALAERY